MEQPILHTERLVLRPFIMADAQSIHQIVSDREVAATTLSIPHPYPDDGAIEWLKSIEQKWPSGTGAVYAITLASSRELIGSIDLRINRDHQHAELGYLVARPHWGRGYVTEAARALVHMGFTTLGLRRIFAHHMTINPSSGAIMRKIGMRYEGTMREHIIKWGEARDVAFYGMMYDDYQQS